MFCIVKGHEELGTAKLLEAIGKRSVVEYFDCPGTDGTTVKFVDSANIVPKTLGTNTRVYFHDLEKSVWRVGRVLDDTRDASYVRFANKDDREIPHSQLYVRWRRPIADPLSFLANGLTETPLYADARSEFLRSYIAQRAASGGISSLISSAIELEPHQIEVVRRVLNDTSQRYLLADEVGLGKTIEAGVLIRQAVLDDPVGHKIVVLAPATLTHQWKTELSVRFSLEDFLDVSVLIYAADRVEEFEGALPDTTMLVIDEAHHLTATTDEQAMRTYAAISRVAPSIDRLLLLSATPALRNEAGFLRLLHLLDPATYKLEDEAEFRHKIANRQSLAEAVAALVPDNALSLDRVLDDLADKLPSDVQLHVLIATLRTQLDRIPEPDDPDLEAAITPLRAHLSETYRLHRRILRNRRKNLRFITPDRSGSDTWYVQGGQASRLETMLEDWRLHAIANSSGDSQAVAELSSFYSDVIAALVEDPRELAHLCEARIRRIDRAQAAASFPQETSVLGQIVDVAADDSWLLARLERLKEGVAQLLARSKRAAIFCASETAADEVFSYLQQARVGTTVRHSSAEEEGNSWRRFSSNSSIKVLVCGPLAEEGLNLQGNERVIVHFDLPFAPNRIEQRIGRIDRYGAGSAVRSVVLLDDGAEMQAGWHALLARGLGVFSRSIASLQYLLQDEMQRLKNSLFSEGSSIFDALVAEYSGDDGKVTRELRLLNEQDALDELAPDRGTSSEALQEIDGDWKTIRKAVTHWAVDTLLFDIVSERDNPEFRSLDPPFRFRYQKPTSMGSATLIPLLSFILEFVGVFDPEAPEGSSSQPLSHRYSAHRKSAINRGARVLRYGDAFIEALKNFSDVDDRGRSFATWRQHASAPEGAPTLYFRFDFLIEVDLRDAGLCLEQAGLADSAAARAAISRRGDGLFAPNTIRVWLTEESDLVPDEDVERCLDLPYAKERGLKPYVDTNLSSVKLHHAMQALPGLFDEWPARCRSMRDRAQVLVTQNDQFLSQQSDALKEALNQSTVRQAQLTARMHNQKPAEAEREKASLHLETELDRALRSGIASPAVRLDVVGFVVLSRQAFADVVKADGT